MNKNQNKVTFATNEELIKVYRYFSSSRKDEVGEIERSLIVSTKRIIAESTTEKGFTREEFPVDAIDRVDTSFYHAKRGLLGFGLIIFGIIIFTLSFIENFTNIIPYLNIGLKVVGSLLFILGIVYFIIKKPRQAFKLTFYSKHLFYDLATLSGENFVIRERKSKRKKEAKQVKIVSKITPAALVMINEINGLIIDLQELNYELKHARKQVASGNMNRDSYTFLRSSLVEKIKELYK